MSWESTNEGTVKLNSDGASRGNPGAAKAEVYQTYQGIPILCYANECGHITKIFSETLANWYGLKLSTF